MKLYKIKKSKIDKYGLYANCNIGKGTKIIEYKGKLFQQKKVKLILSLITEKQFIFLISIKDMILMVILNLIRQD